MPTVEEILSSVPSYPEEGEIPPEMGTLRQHTMRKASGKTHIIPALISRP
jgi:hypothetical protein